MDRGTPPRCSHEIQVCKIRVIWIRGRFQMLYKKRREEKRRKEEEVREGEVK